MRERVREKERESARAVSRDFRVQEMNVNALIVPEREQTKNDSEGKYFGEDEREKERDGERGGDGG